MHNVTIPLNSRSPIFNKEAALAELLRSKADRVLLTLERDFLETPEGLRINTEQHVEKLAQLIPYFANAGLEVGIWVGQTIGHGWGPKGNFAYRAITDLEGNPADGGFCPDDPLFAADICRWVTNVAKTGTKLILLDDDFRMTSHGTGHACCMCPHHVEKFSRLAGRAMTREEIVQAVFQDNNPQMRRLWQTCMGSSLLDLAQKMRQAVDAVDPEIRMGPCTVYYTIDHDGADFMALARALAGNTRPYVRLKGAPFWANERGNVLSEVITGERIQAHWARDFVRETGAELLSEGDPFPRPRFAGSAAMLEMLDQILTADGNLHGCQKYIMDYYSSARYETGYIHKHLKNLPIYELLDREFAPGEALGFRLMEFQHQFANAELPEGLSAAEASRLLWNRAKGISVNAITDASMPISFTHGVPVVFGDNAKYVDLADIASGALLDIPAARILQERGVDVGLVSYKPSSEVNLEGSPTEFYIGEQELVLVSGAKLYAVETKAGAEIMTLFSGKAPAAYRYENEAGARFMVYPLDAEPFFPNRLFRTYARQRELVKIYEWIAGEPLAAVCLGNPDLYIMVKKHGDTLAVGLWNLFPDSIDEPLVQLGLDVEDIQYFFCHGTQEGRTVKLSELQPYAFCGFKARIR